MSPKSTTRDSSNSELYRFHRPKLRVHETPHPLKRESELCLQNLSTYRTRRPIPPFPRTNTAAVLVALFVGRAGDLYVLLSQRAKTLTSYAGDTALPGGRVDDEDRTIEDTARREAFEEIGLPQDKARLPLLCILDPFLAGNQVLVTPVVVLILDNTLQPVLNAPEVDTLFSHPLASFLSTSFPERAAPRGPFPEAEALAETAALELEYHTYADVAWPWPWVMGPATPESAGRAVRMHRFLTGREAGGIKPIFGLTAAILIWTAAVAYGHPPEFLVQAHGEPELGERVAWSLRHPRQKLEEAVRKEDFDAERAARIWDKWEGGRWKAAGRFRQRMPSRL
ncbi:NUDIX hydrolase domain-like protein [Multifurca ochricompacta]|uniref:NUDIX hydrolase domain-like protein n=1 Tax=Multifurca ochricompacta TaxID=376703 RepID=A0AAD4M576_9AGAM|nr:NUDIX hydrolase domain-like protein [Multifurca ochricompacta]